MEEWHDRVPPDLEVGAAVAWDAAAMDGAGSRVVVTRLTERVLRVETGAEIAGGTASRPAARSSTAALWAVQPARLDVRAALTSGAPISPGADAATSLRLDGRDTLPVGWRCSAADSASVAALATASPVVLPPASLAGGTLTDVGAALPSRYELEWPPSDSLRLSGPIVFGGDLHAPPVAPRDAGHCLAGPEEPLNWGDSRRPSPCAGWLPLVRVRGNLDRPTGRGQGVLLVDGDLTLAGGFEFGGVIVVRGRLVATGAGNRVVGAILALGSGARPHELDALTVRYSSCVVRSALAASGVLRPVSPRGWASWW